MRYTVVPDPIDANPGDDFGFSETFDYFDDARSYSAPQQKDIWDAWVMPQNFDPIDKALNLETNTNIVKSEETIVEIEVGKIEEIIPKNTNTEDIKKDYEYTRVNLYSLIEKGQEAINGILELAGEGGSPRAYEVAGQLIKSVGDVTDKLMDLQKKLKDVEEETSKTTNNVTNNALFVGSTAELSKLLKQGLLNTKE